MQEPRPQPKVVEGLHTSRTNAPRMLWRRGQSVAGKWIRCNKSTKSAFADSRRGMRAEPETSVRDGRPPMELAGNKSTKSLRDCRPASRLLRTDVPSAGRGEACLARRRSPPAGFQMPALPLVRAGSHARPYEP